MSFPLPGKLALVTGASSGLGAHFARVLARAGARVIVTARRHDALTRLVAEIEAKGGHATALSLDVTNAESIARIAPQLAEIDILVNNAGVATEGPALEQSEADWDSVIDTNLKGVFLMAQTAGRAMKARGRGGSIINIASILGLRQTAGLLPYTTSKAGVIQLTKTLALEVARFNIRVNAIAPGYFDTPMNEGFFDTPAGQAVIKRIPQRRTGRLEDLDGALLLLASEASAYMTGIVIPVDGGHLVTSI